MKPACRLSLAALLSGLAVALVLVGCGQGGISDPLQASSGTLPPALVPIVGLSAKPANVVVSGTQDGITTLTAQLVDPSNHQPASGVTVTFSTSLGQLAHSTVATDKNGIATDDLTVAAGTPNSTANTAARAHGASQSVKVPVSNLATITLSASPSATQCSSGGAAISAVQALASDSSGNPVANVQILFSADSGSITPRATTDSQGAAAATFSAPPGTPDGRVSVSAQALGVLSNTTFIQISGCAGQPGPPPSGGGNTLQFVSANPTQIGVVGSNLPHQSTVIFKLTDSHGNGVGGTKVNFFISSVGGDSVAPQSAATGTDGSVQTVLSAGERATATQVTASTGSVAATSSQITIVGGFPVQGRLSISATFQNIAGNKTAGLTDSILAVMQDRFGNPVQPGTAVDFRSVGGSAHPQSSSDSNGIATGVLEAVAPTDPTDLNGMHTGGVATVLVLAQGETPFIDSDGNGVWDPGETVVAVPEPFWDLNGNGVRDSNEPYVDVNHNGVYDSDQSGGQFSQNVTVFVSMRVTFSGPTQVAVAPSSGFVIPNGGSQQFTLSLMDNFGNPLVGGSTYHVDSAPAGRVQGADGTVPDGESFGQQVSGLNMFTFTVTDSDPNNNSAEPITITVTVTSPPSQTSPGGNGNATTSTSGTMD